MCLLLMQHQSPSVLVSFIDSHRLAGQKSVHLKSCDCHVKVFTWQSRFWPMHYIGQNLDFFFILFFLTEFIMLLPLTLNMLINR